jgi:ketosteroid isomerase-like protein
MCNGKNLAVGDEIFTGNHTYHDPASPWVGPGPDGMKQLIGTYHRGFSNARWTVEETLTAGDRIIVRWSARATQDGPLYAIAPTGRSVTVAGIWIFRVANGKIVESWNCWDALGMMQQLGLVSEPSGTAAN